jgi:recombination protein RecR
MVEAIEKLVESLSRLPTVGRKSAWRLALHMLQRPQEELALLADSIAQLKQKVHICRECFNYADTELCSICASPRRDAGILCVVEKPTDVFTLERAGRYSGRYHVLGGLISPINGVTADKLTIAQLRERIERCPPQELIIGLGGSGEAETTAHYLARLFGASSIKITRLARGLPAGMELEYIDQLTLTQALTERIDITHRTGL